MKPPLTCPPRAASRCLSPRYPQDCEPSQNVLSGCFLPPPSLRPANATACLSWAFTLIELLVVIAIIAVLAAILLPVISSVRSKADMTSAVANATELVRAGVTFTSDHDGLVCPYNPPGPKDADGNVTERFWHIPVDDMSTLASYLNPKYRALVVPDDRIGMEKYRKLPAWVGNDYPSFGYNQSIFRGYECRMVNVVKPQTKILFAESGHSTGTGDLERPGGGESFVNTRSGPARPYARRSGACVVAFLDGHIEVIQNAKDDGRPTMLHPNGNVQLEDAHWWPLRPWPYPES